MLSVSYSYGLTGLEAYPVTIEIDVSMGLPGTSIVGLPDSAVKESRERVRAAIRNSGYKYKAGRITVNLSPADIRKEGPSFDLAIALGVLAATEQIDGSRLKDYVILGELSLDGGIRPVRGVLPIALSVPKEKYRGFIVPASNAREAAVSRDIPVFPVHRLSEVVHLLHQPDRFKPLNRGPDFLDGERSSYGVDLSDVKGQIYIRRGLEVAAAGAHNVLMIGPPGSGKTMLAKRLRTILPDMTFEEALETTKIHSVLGLVPPGQDLMTLRPFRCPHHTSSDVALVGGGTIPRPGEVTLAHNGVLFLDELPEFNRNVLEALRQPLEDRCVTVSRASRTTRFPANFMLVASMNPCICGHFGNPRVACHCNPTQIQRYRSKISGPLLDRIDIHLDVPAVNYHELTNTRPAETSAQIKERVNKARTIQLERFSSDGSVGHSGKENCTFSNAQMNRKRPTKASSLKALIRIQ